MTGVEKLRVRATRTRQGNGVEIYSFFLRGADVARIADINRVGRSNEELEGFQRPEIKNHVRSIVEFLDSGPVLFPNAIILAFSSDVVFRAVRGRGVEGCSDISDGGVITIPVRSQGKRAAWIVDGQQRSLALAQAKNDTLVVPVVGFLSADLATHREQFILVNKARPLSARLIDELLPKVGGLLPQDLEERRLPSLLTDELAKDPNSPFYKMLKRKSDPVNAGLITDSALRAAIGQNLKSSMGALSQYRGGGEVDTDAMYRTLFAYWSAVRDAFPDAWGKKSTQSRLTHSAGIRAMGVLMDQIMVRADSTADAEAEVRTSLERLAPHCRWTSGEWDELGLKWNQVQSSPQDIQRLAEHLCRIDRKLARVKP
ncbi:DGQHR domain-containing protein DpdB [Sphingomonas sp. CBMAI 2297]|uniref:DGQHR domain-containing protein DpdB n=1 Tax=Sphingomonas sp. CBMAI 2297 TaxID=2991720 RepID=UPI0024582F65|nr:DGQHR domain-containing protein DpdB [Sphingomonas sp. CBMAI 2297]MDH4744214.1 DGQHR domain-containing protein DpdB [Sphingomonas sp. CBMAI 2297]